VTVTASAPPAYGPGPTGAAPAADAAPATAEAHPGAVTSPMVGVVYMAPEPGAPNFIKVGDTVDEGATLLLIEAMKTFNPLRAPRGGRIAAILGDDATPVEYGEALVVIE
jgi:acetyl-CoA carboxylase biotin carboxyl carrier protein